MTSIMIKGSKMQGLYILDDSTFIGHASLDSQDLHDKTKL